MNSPTIEDLIQTNAPLQNPDGTENKEAVDAVNELGAELARLFAPPPTGGRRRTYRRRRRDVRRTRYVRRR